MRLDTDSLRLAGATITADISDVLTTLTVDYGTDSVAQLTISASDDRGIIARTALMTPGTAVLWQGDTWQVGARTTARGSDATILHTFDCRSTLARGLRRNFKASAEKKVSPSEWITRRVAAAGGTATCQPSSKQGTIAQTSGDQRQSELDVIGSLCSDQGWSWIEWGGHLIAGTRYWAWQGNAGLRLWPVTWDRKASSDAIASEITVDDDDTDNVASGTVTLPYDYGVKLRPWDRLSLSGFGVDDGIYLVEKVALSADTTSPISVDVTQPRLPAKKSGSSK